MIFKYKYVILLSYVYVHVLFLSAESSNNDIVVFYNVYVNDPDRVMKIVKEQLEHREKSIAQNAPLYYVTIGKDVGELKNCKSCKRIEHHDKGSEIVTLSHLYEYCTNHQDSKVVYMHNKGSFHFSKKNTMFRNMLNKGVLSSDCILLKTPRAEQKLLSH